MKKKAPQAGRAASRPDRRGLDGAVPKGYPGP